MDLYRLSQPAYLFDKVIEGYSSLIWTERYQQYGECELETANVASTMADLPLGSLVTLNDTKEVVLIDTHQITKQEDGSKTLKVSGRSIFGFLDERAAIIDDLPLNTVGSWVITSTAAAALTNVLKYHIVDGTIDTKDILPNVTVPTASGITSDLSTTRQIPRKSLYAVALDLMQEQNLGVRTYRPTGVITTMQIFVYQGIDNTSTVVLYEKNGDFITTNYLRTIRGSKTYVYGSAPRVNSNLAKTGTSTWTGFTRRDALNDCSDISASTTTLEGQILAARNRKVLGENPTITAFDCEVSSAASVSFSLKDRLGNVIKCISDFGATQSMRITEYTRISDSNGEREYPTLVMI